MFLFVSVFKVRETFRSCKSSWENNVVGGEIDKRPQGVLR